MPTVEDVIARALTSGSFQPGLRKPVIWSEHNTLVIAIATALREAGMVREWQKIETAPKDGVWCLLWSEHPDGRPHVSVRQYRRWSGGGTHDEPEMLWVDHLACISRSLHFTHWMPLPPLPEGTDK